MSAQHEAGGGKAAEETGFVFVSRQKKQAKFPCLMCSGKVECADEAFRLNSKINNQTRFSLALLGGFWLPSPGLFVVSLKRRPWHTAIRAFCLFRIFY